MGQGNPWARRILLVVLAGIVSIVAVNFIGDLTLYSLRNVEPREWYHQLIIENKAPPKGWTGEGMNGSNIRIAVPYLVEFLHRQTGADVAKLYKAVDLASLWLGMVLFYGYLAGRFRASESALACAYFVAMLPLTFAYHNYMPWDRASFAAWLAALWLARSQRFLAFCVAAVVGLLIKYDAIVLPALYFLGHATMRAWRKPLAQSCLLAAVLAGIFWGLLALLPGGFEPRPYGALILRNIAMMIHQGPAYAPTLAFGLPAVLAILGYRASDQFSRAGIWVAALVAAILFASTNFEEVRAEQMLFPLLAPAALTGLRRVLGQPETAATTPRTASQ
ncbi:MAG TPA: hypothetical protein VHZ32_20010 [Rhizomicrobium sp.]|nr:hypothetical protein [Rhizomicrobium sp.]